jgi:hypothetical protein
VSQQQRLADIASLRLTQYLVRLPDKEDTVKGMQVKRKSDAKDTHQEKEDSVVEAESEEEGEEDMDEDMDESGEDDEQGEDEIDEDASYH